MKKYLILIATLLLYAQLLPAQKIYDYTVDYAGYTWFSYPCTGLDNVPGSSCRNKEAQIKTEVPPWIIGGGWRTYFLNDGIGSSAASSPASMLGGSGNTEINFKSNGGDPARITNPSGCPGGASEPWRYNYYCVYSAQYINHPSAGTVSLGFVEGENHTQVSAGQPPVSCDYVGWDAHSSYLCGSWLPNTAATNWGQGYFTNDMGPIVWPATGYFTANGVKTSAGCANNASIQADGYIYLFYKDQSYDIGSPDPGRRSGIKVARVPITDALNPLAYQTFYEDANGIHWNQSLPAGFNKNYISSYLNGAMGPQGSVILETNRDYIRFSVAKVAGKNYYLGLGSYADANGNWVTVLKYSTDLLHWQGDREVDRASSWTTCQFNYPIFLNTSGWSNTEVGEDDFYIIGTNPYPSVNNAVYRKRCYIYVEPPPPPPICYDEWGNQVLCPTARMATNNTTETLDNSKGRTPYVFPNPGPGVFQLRYTLKGVSKTQMNVLDLMGRQVQTKAAVSRNAGTYTETVNISGQAKGIYFIELVVNGKKQTFKVIYQ